MTGASGRISSHGSQRVSHDLYDDDESVLKTSPGVIVPAVPVKIHAPAVIRIEDGTYCDYACPSS